MNLLQAVDILLEHSVAVDRHAYTSVDCTFAEEMLNLLMSAYCGIAGLSAAAVRAE